MSMLTSWVQKIPHGPGEVLGYLFLRRSELPRYAGMYPPLPTFGMCLEMTLLAAWVVTHETKARRVFRRIHFMQQPSHRSSPAWIHSHSHTTVLCRVPPSGRTPHDSGRNTARCCDLSAKIY
jgi:hypothetical protein